MSDRDLDQAQIQDITCPTRCNWSTTNIYVRLKLICFLSISCNLADMAKRWLTDDITH